MKVFWRFWTISTSRERPILPAFRNNFPKMGHTSHWCPPPMKSWAERQSPMPCKSNIAPTYECRCEIHASAAMGPFVDTERTDHVTLHKADRKVGSRVCAVFVLNDAGLIVSWREYWDSGAVILQMSVTADELAAAM
jgi:limonene-1,2-epoxide hydrolase